MKVSKGFLATLTIVAVVAVCGYFWWNTYIKNLTYDEYIAREYKRLKAADVDDLDDIEKGLAESLTDDQSSLESAVAFAMSKRSNIQFKAQLKHVGKRDWNKQFTGENGWKHLFAASKLAEKAKAEISDSRAIWDGRISEQIDDQDAFMVAWAEIEPFLDKAESADYLTFPYDDELQWVRFYHLKMYALVTDFIELADNPEEKFSRVTRLINLEAQASLPPATMREAFKTIWVGNMCSALRSAYQLRFLSLEESKGFSLQFPSTPSLLEVMEAEIFSMAASEPSDGGEYSGMFLERRYDKYETQPGDIGEWMAELEEESKAYFEDMASAINWLRDNPGDLAEEEYAQKVIDQNLAGLNAGDYSTILEHWAEMAERRIHAQSLLDPVSEEHEPDWINNTPMLKGVIEGNEVVFSWDEEHPLIKHIGKSGEVVRIKWK